MINKMHLDRPDRATSKNLQNVTIHVGPEKCTHEEIFTFSTAQVGYKVSKNYLYNQDTSKIYICKQASDKYLLLSTFTFLYIVKSVLST